MAIPTVRDNSSAINKLSWDRKWRPDSLSAYVGNKAVVNSMTNLVRADKLPHTILLQGTRGCGKTSFARLLSKEILCINRTPEGLSCGTCPTCKETLERCIKLALPETRGVKEYNMSQMTGKDDITNLILKARERPIPPFSKLVFILDEIHRLSAAAQDAFLKLAEEPPDYVYIIMCTTDPEQLNETLLSRSRRFKIKKPTISELVERLTLIVRNEGVKYDPNALQLIAQKTARIPREAINALEHVANNAGMVTVDNVIKTMDIIADEVYIKFFEVLDKDIVDIYNYIHSLEEKDIDYSDFIKGLVEFVLDCINMKFGIKLESYQRNV